MGVCLRSIERMDSLEIENLYLRYGPMVLRRCQSLLKDEARAKDAMQDTFIRVLEKYGGKEIESPSSFFYQVATSVCFNLIRHDRVTEKHSKEVQKVLDFYNGMEKNIWSRMASTLFEGELESTRFLAVLVFVDGYTLEEAAKEVGMSVSGVRKRLRNLKERVQEKEGQDE